MKRVALIVAAMFVLGATPDAAIAHVTNPVYASTCKFDWHTVTGNEKMIRCFANYFDLNADKAEGIARCESGLQFNPGNRTWNPHSYSGHYGTWQYAGGTWNGVKGHYLPNVANASPLNARHATIVTMRYVKHNIGEGDANPWHPWTCSYYWQNYV